MDEFSSTPFNIRRATPSLKSDRAASRQVSSSVSTVTLISFHEIMAAIGPTTDDEYESPSLPFTVGTHPEIVLA
jgi:hypothetical protein